MASSEVSSGGDESPTSPLDRRAPPGLGSSAPSSSRPPDADFVVLRKLRDESECDELKQAWSSEDPRLWTCDFGGGQEPCVEVEDGRVQGLGLSFSSLVALPDAIGELDALKELLFAECTSLVALPDAIGELGALTTLYLKGCSSLAELPAAIGELGALTRLNLSRCTSLAELPATIGGLGALTTLDLSECSKLVALPAAIGGLGALKTLRLEGCSNLVALPAAIGELGELKELLLSGCSSLAALPDAIGELGALTTLDLSGCSSLEPLPEGIVREGLTVKLPWHLMNLDDTPASLREDLTALRKLRDESECDELQTKWSADDPREWVNEEKGAKGGSMEEAVTVKDGRVTEFDLSQCEKLVALPAAIGELGALTKLDLGGCWSLAELPAAIGELKTLTTLSLCHCSSLVELPDSISELGALADLDLRYCSSLEKLPAAIGELGALTELNLRDCSSLAALPDSIGKLGALKLELPVQLTPLGDDLAALRKLRDESECDELKKRCSSKDPREWPCSNSATDYKAVTVEGGRVTGLDLRGCEKLVALPAAIGELKALKKLDLSECDSLVTLPAAIGELGALTTLDLRWCSKLKSPPDAVTAREGLNIELPEHLVSEPLRKDFDALRKLRNDDAGDVLKEQWDGEDPREWERVTVKDGRVTGLVLSDLAMLPDAIGELDALTRLDLRGCSRLVEPAAIGELDHRGLVVLLPTHLIPGSLADDLDALRRCCQPPNPSEDPMEWKNPFGGGKCVTVDSENNRVTELRFREKGSIRGLSVAVGELKALKELELRQCRGLVALPDAIGKLGALTTLDVSECTSLAELPATIGELGALTTLNAAGLPFLRLGADLPFGKLGELKTLNLSSCWFDKLPDSIGELGALTSLSLSGCRELAALPDAIGGLRALTTLNLSYCEKLVALPESIGSLDALTTLSLDRCDTLTFPSLHIHGDVWRVQRLLANTTRFLTGKLKAADADDDAKEDFLKVIDHAPFADRLEAAVRKDPALADLTNDKGQRAIEAAASPECRYAMQKALMFLGRYDIADGPPEHRSATSLVVRAVDAATDYGKLFDDFDKNKSGMLDTDELEALAANLGTNVDTFKLRDGEKYTKDAFVARFGKERKVVIKIFQVEEQWKNEKKARDDLGLDAQFVVQTIEAPTDDEFAKALDKSSLFTEPRFGGSVGRRAIVMDAADRNLFQIYQSERPDVNTVRVLMRQVMECVQHLHEKGLVHGDIKMLNVVRLSLDNRLRLIDLDAAAKISGFGSGDTSYVGSKFSSAILPPECFARLEGDQVKQFEAYFSNRENEDVDQEKVARKVDKEGTSYVVKTFIVENGLPKNKGHLPYELVKATEAVDYWSLGALLFQLVAGEPLVPSNRDDDCVDAYGMAALASWNDEAARERLKLLSGKNGEAWDLASKLLVREPSKRLTIEAALETHPFLNPELLKSGNLEMLEYLERIDANVKDVKADVSIILKLSEENKVELRRTRQVLLKGIFEATEVKTPTCFVVLKKKLPPLNTEQKDWIQKYVVLKDDGTGVEILGEEPTWWLDMDDRGKDLKTYIEDRIEEGKGWIDQLNKFKPEDALTSKTFVNLVKERLKKFTTKDTLYFYLVDELTGEPVRGAGYPIEITEPTEVVSRLLPVMQVGMRAMSVYNGVAGVAQMFGYPLPKVPKKLREGAQSSVDLFKQESSVEAFGAIHEKAKDKNEEEKSVRGASLRELEQFFEKHPESNGWAGLRRIGSPEDGTALWTCVPDHEVAQKLKERTAQRLEEARLREEQEKEADAKAEKKEFLAEVEKTVVELNKRECCAIA